MTLNIHEIDAQIDALLDASEGEITPEVEALVQEQENVEKWIENATKKLLNERASRAALASEKARIAELLSARDRTIDRLESTISRLIGEGNKRDLGFARVSWRRSESVQILDGKEEAIPDAYLIPKWVANKTQIKADLKAGAEIPYCFLVEKQNIQIK